MKSSHLFIYIALFVASLTIFAGCDKMDDNGPFEGYWVLMEYDGYDGNQAGDLSTETLITEGGDLINDLGAQTSENITWGVRNQLLLIRNQTLYNQYFCHFTRNAHELVILDAYANDGSNDTKIGLSELPENLCIPADGKFAIVTLTKKKMVLKANGVTMTFKKN